MRSKGPKTVKTQTGFWTPRTRALIIGGVVGVIALSFVLPGLFRSSSPSEAAHAKAMGVAVGAGVPAGSPVPSFSEKNLLNGQPITSKTVYDKKTLLFFSEGVMCQACFEQIMGLQKVGTELARRGIQLVSITPDTPRDLSAAVGQYDITTPIISDENRDMSASFNTLGQGMHSDTPGHSFALIYHGKVLWYRDYYLGSSPTMYVQPGKLLADITKAA